VARIRHACVAPAIVLAASLAALAVAAQPPVFPVLPVSVGIAATASGPAADAAWIDAQLARTNEIYGPHGLTFRIAERRPIDARYARLENRADRHALGAELRPRVINVFVVESLRDVDDPALLRMGVHWRPRGRTVPRGAHLVIVTGTAMPTTLAHELGHFFGNGHSPTPGNLMSYSRGNVPAFLDAAQVRRIHLFARRFLRTRELVP
jgi:hypothetical protein